MSIKQPAANDTFSPAEINAIFRRLRALKRAFGGNKNELAELLIGACILEGFDTRPRIVGTLVKLDLNHDHAAMTLRTLEGRTPGWRRDDAGHYHLLDTA